MLLNTCFFSVGLSVLRAFSLCLLALVLVSLTGGSEKKRPDFLSY